MASDTYSFDILGAVSNGRGEEGDARAEERTTVKRSGYSRHKCTSLCTDVHWKKMCMFSNGGASGCSGQYSLGPQKQNDLCETLLMRV